MQFEVSDLLFPGFTKDAMKRLDKQYGIEFFYEFGKDYYWKQQVEEWGERALSIHAPCVALNLADSKQKNYVRVIEKTFAYAQKCKADFVVVHTNEAIEGDKELLRARVIRRLRQIMNLGKRYGVKVLIENVGCAQKIMCCLICRNTLRCLTFFRRQVRCLIQVMRMSTAGIFLL